MNKTKVKIFVVVLGLIGISLCYGSMSMAKEISIKGNMEILSDWEYDIWDQDCPRAGGTCTIDLNHNYSGISMEF